jgi:hypothetical protein
MGYSCTSRFASVCLCGLLIGSLILPDTVSACGVSSVDGETTACQQITGGNLAIVAPSSIAFPSITTQAYDQVNSVVFPNDISVYDLRNSTAGFSLSMSTTDFGSGGKKIDFSNLAVKTSAPAIISGGTSLSQINMMSGVASAHSSAHSRFSNLGSPGVSGPKTLMTASSGISRIGQFKTKPELELVIPAFTPLGNYKANITFSAI